ncbi:MAG: hypothetical protein HC822_23500 [Oscillochloris sp.]|nr:hypothetical protein [Oscillochloris sp.]
MNEILAAPGERFSQEWVEIINADLQPIDPTGWLIDDANDGAAVRITAEMPLAPGATLLISFERAMLNNSGDSVRLIRPDGQVQDRYSYTSARPDVSFSRTSDNTWHDNDPPTPGSPNRTIPAMPSEAGSGGADDLPPVVMPVAPDRSAEIGFSASEPESAPGSANQPGRRAPLIPVGIPQALQAGVLTPAPAYYSTQAGSIYHLRQRRR